MGEHKIQVELSMETQGDQRGASVWQRLKRHFTESFSGELVARPQGPGGGKREGWRDTRRSNAYRYISILFAMVILPFAIQNIVTGAWQSAIGSGLLFFMVLANIWALSTGRKAVLSPLVVMLLSAGLVFYGWYQGQDFALSLFYPLMVAAPVLLRPRSSFLVSAVTCAVLVPLMLFRYDLLTTVSVGLSLVLCWVISAWLVFAVTVQARKLRRMAITDPLTGAYNRRYLEQQAGKCLETWTRHQRKFSLLLLDIDHFKWINDTFGHAVGDGAIQNVVELIKQRMRKVDVLCRYGGEEFVLLLSEASGEQAMQVANEIRASVESAEILPKGKLTVSIGVCDVVLAENPEHWLKMADVAMYLAKLNGRNRVELAVSAAETGKAANATYYKLPEMAHV